MKDCGPDTSNRTLKEVNRNKPGRVRRPGPGGVGSLPSCNVVRGSCCSWTHERWRIVPQQCSGCGTLVKIVNGAFGKTTKSENPTYAAETEFYSIRPSCEGNARIRPCRCSGNPGDGQRAAAVSFSSLSATISSTRSPTTLWKAGMASLLSGVLSSCSRWSCTNLDPPELIFNDKHKARPECVWRSAARQINRGTTPPPAARGRLLS